MENKNSVLVFSIIFLIIGVFVGWLICSNKEARTAIPTGTHMMGNGEMMNNNGMGMNGAMDSMMAGLSGKTGDAFDKAFIEEMIMHHEGAVAMAQAALKNAKHPEIKIMKGWLKDWYGEEYKDNN